MGEITTECHTAYLVLWKGNGTMAGVYAQPGVILESTIPLLHIINIFALWAKVKNRRDAVRLIRSNPGKLLLGRSVTRKGYPDHSQEPTNGPTQVKSNGI